MDLSKRLWRCLFIWKIPPAPGEKLATAQVIVTQACSRLKNSEPGPGNNTLAQVTRWLSEHYQLSVIPQEEVVMADPNLPCIEVVGGSPDGRSTPSWNTWTIAEIQAGICRREELRSVIVVADPAHMGRAVWVYEAQGLKALPAPMPRDMRRYIFRDAVHWSRRALWLIYFREFCARVLFLLQGRI